MASQSPLLRLPRELRDQILRYAFDDVKQEDVNFDQLSRYKAYEKVIVPPLDKLPALCKTSKQLYYEATPEYLTHVTPLLPNVETIIWMRKWLATFPDDVGFRAIRQLAFRNFFGPEQIKGYELIMLCPKLSQLSIMFGDELVQPRPVPSFTIKSLSSVYNEYETFDNIVLIHQLHKLLDIPKLERLDLRFHEWRSVYSSSRTRQVGEWLRMKFIGAGKTVQINCKAILHENDLRERD